MGLAVTYFIYDLLPVGRTGKLYEPHSETFMIHDLPSGFVTATLFLLVLQRLSHIILTTILVTMITSLRGGDPEM